MVPISASSQSSIAAQQNNVLADRRLSRSRVAARGGRGGPARIAMRTLRANAECAYISFHLYCFRFIHLLILCLNISIGVVEGMPCLCIYHYSLFTVGDSNQEPSKW